jgi:hypothetical protein
LDVITAAEIIPILARLPLALSSSLPRHLHDIRNSSGLDLDRQQGPIR